jgi:hypothetical protein
MVKRQEQLQDDSLLSSLASDDSSQTKRDLKWLAKAKERSQELFFSDIQDLLLQREHFCARA